MASLLAIFNSFKKTGKSVTLTLSTKGGEVTAKLEIKLTNAIFFINQTPSFNSDDSTWMPGFKRLSTTSPVSCKEHKGKHQDSSASATPGAALPWRRLHCCSGFCPSSSTSPLPSLSTNK